VKYFWRDAIRNQLKDNDAKKATLATRLSSLDVSGLGISKLRGRTLVKYCGSLVGRDFRAIAQVAPFVLYDLVSPECFNVWKSLSRLVPLIWQPEIKDLHTYLVCSFLQNSRFTLLTEIEKPVLEREIQSFLTLTAQWTPAWFNKPKFHILVHLPDHIRCFGPAILFATEAFESFNAVIRAKSVHSNRGAPSRDIAKAFAQGNRIRHLLSGGKFPRHGLGFSTMREDWRCAGPRALALVEPGSTINSYLGMNTKCREYDGEHPSDFSAVTIKTHSYHYP
jgi:hypothetical protein